MQRSNILIISLIVAAVCSSVVVTFVHAQSITPKESKVQAWCNKIVPNLQVRIADTTANIAKRQIWVASRKQKLQDRINKLQQKGANVTQLTSDFQTFSAKMDIWVADLQTGITDFKATQQYTCGDAQGKFVQSVKTARQQMQIVRQDGQVMSSFSKNTLRPDFINAIAQIKQSKMTTPRPTQ